MYHQNTAHQKWLESALIQLEGMAGTIHIPRDNYLFLTAAVHIPVSVLTFIARVQSGKGMPGLAQTRKVAVQTSDLHTEGASQQANTQTSIAVPLLAADGAVQAVIGFAWNQTGDLDPQRQQAIAAKVAEFATLL